jgi:hypothetical protein
MNSTPQKEHNLEYTGDQSPHINLMSVVEHSRLIQGHTFPDKDTLMIRVAEEANYVLKSCKMQYEVAGDMFYMRIMLPQIRSQITSFRRQRTLPNLICLVTQMITSSTVRQ